MLIIGQTIYFDVPKRGSLVGKLRKICKNYLIVESSGRLFKVTYDYEAIL